MQQVISNFAIVRQVLQMPLKLGPNHVSLLNILTKALTGNTVSLIMDSRCDVKGFSPICNVGRKSDNDIVKFRQPQGAAADDKLGVHYGLPHDHVLRPGHRYSFVWHRKKDVPECGPISSGTQSDVFESIRPPNTRGVIDR